MTSWKDMMNTLQFWGIDKMALASLKQKSNEKIRVVPKGEDMYRTFRVTDIHNIKAIILGGEPYPYGEHANGLPFSSFQEETPKDLEIIKEYIKDWKKDAEIECNDLEYWSKQGILLLNIAFSTEYKKPGSMIKEWTHFTRQVLYYLTVRQNGIVFWTLGNLAAKMVNDIVVDPIHINTPHPYEYIKSKQSPIDGKGFVNPLNFIHAHLPEGQKTIDFSIKKVK